nr:recombinase family protein [Maliibacterium massiliense]
MNTYGYVRVSTRDQNEDRQLLAMAQFPVAPQHIYMDKLSGKDFNRPAYRRLLRRLKKGDVLVVKSIDRLGRNYDEILAQWRVITKDKCADVVVLDMPLLDTRQGRDLTGTLIADIVLQLLSYVAQTERENIRLRQAEGIAAAKLKGVRFGRPSLPVPQEFYPLYAQWQAGQISGCEAARRLHVAHNTFFKWARSATAGPSGAQRTPARATKGPHSVT